MKIRFTKIALVLLLTAALGLLPASAALAAPQAPAPAATADGLLDALWSWFLLVLPGFDGDRTAEPAPVPAVDATPDELAGIASVSGDEGVKLDPDN